MKIFVFIPATKNKCPYVFPKTKQQFFNDTIFTIYNIFRTPWG